VLLTITGLQFLCFGLLGELLVRTTVTSREIFSIRSERERQRSETRATKPGDSITSEDSPRIDPSAETRRDIPLLDHDRPSSHHD
jgi:hypothetical protein